MTGEHPRRRPDSWGLIAFVLGTCALLSTAAFYPLGLLLGIAAAWYGRASLQHTKEHRLRGGRTLAYWGLVTGVAGFVVAFGLTVVAALITEDPRIRESIQRELEQQQDSGAGRSDDRGVP